MKYVISHVHPIFAQKEEKLSPSQNRLLEHKIEPKNQEAQVCQVNTEPSTPYENPAGGPGFTGKGAPGIALALAIKRWGFGPFGHYLSSRWKGVI